MDAKEIKTIGTPLWFLIAAALLLSGCQPKVYLMPPPVSLTKDAYSLAYEANQLDGNFLYTLYATNRIPYETHKNSAGYSIFPSDSLKLGFVVHRVGDRQMSWEEFQELSLTQERKKNLVLRQEYVRQIAVHDEDNLVSQVSPQAQGLFDKVNELLETTFIKDIIIYVHGANSNFYRATAQGAQLFHYTGHNALLLTFSWPSAENILKYKVDVLHAAKTVPAFIRLLELLSEHTNAKNLDIIAYSAGAQVVAPALAEIPKQYPELTTLEIKDKFRIGDVYFAAPDTEFKAFVERFLTFQQLVDRTTINLNQRDKVLRLAAMQNGFSRLGRPNTSELDDHEKDAMIQAMRTPSLNVIDAGESEALSIGGAHDYWYTHPWVSNDLLLLLLFDVPPEQRGLETFEHYTGAKVFYFGKDYEQEVRRLIEKNRSETLNRLTPEKEGQL